mmetsp:Transcript_20469/g.62427  ORF Transcript_20469/g.62427 Transcript_20469/m.62427 type:complete len:90 (-) Transcript_20469:21-290(-)
MVSLFATPQCSMALHTLSPLLLAFAVRLVWLKTTQGSLGLHSTTLYFVCRPMYMYVAVECVGSQESSRAIWCYSSEAVVFRGGNQLQNM